MTAFSLAVALPVSSPVYAKVSVNRQHSDEEHQHGVVSNKFDMPNAPVTTEVRQPDRQRPSAVEASDHRQWYAEPDWWVAGFTGALFIATVGLWFFTGLMWSATQKAIADGRKGIAASRIAARAAQRSAKAAEEAVKSNAAALAHAQNVAERDLRPWLTVSVVLGGPLQLERAEGGEGVRLSAGITVKNVGKSAAKNVLIHAESTNAMGLDLDQWFSAVVTTQMERAQRDFQSGELLIPTDSTSMNFGTMIFAPDLARGIMMEGSSWISPCVAVTVTYRAVGSPESIFHAARIYHVMDIREGVTKIVRLADLPLQPLQVLVSTFPRNNEVS